jgi:glucose-1-phosphate thymidylyltransferase
LIKKGIILAGGTGSRLRPTTFAVNKQLLMLYDKPVIYYPLSILMLAEINDILIIVNKGQSYNFQKLLGNGERFGINISYLEQQKPSGIPEAFKIGADFINSENVALILGDNFFYGQGLGAILKNTTTNFSKGANIFLKKVKDPEKFGVAKLHNKKILKIIEKPKRYISNQAITGLYFFDNTVVERTKFLKPSKRGETEITDLINSYHLQNKLKYTSLGLGSVWSDTGTVNDLLDVTNYIHSIDKIQNFKIACLEEIALQKQWITKKAIKNNLKKNIYKNSYSRYLENIIENNV